MDTEDRPPLFRSWRAWYILLLIALGAEILFFAWLTNHFS
jgi:hypothetical protein